MKTLRPYQRDLLAYAAREDHPALFVEMRLGKTLVTLRRIAQYAPRDGRTLRALVVAPGSALESWRAEADGEGWTIWDLRGTSARRLAGLMDLFATGGERRLALLNKEGWVALPEVASSWARWDAVIADESTFLKSPTAKVTKFFLRHFRDVPHRWILTGTPCPESEADYFCQLAFLRGGAFGFRRFWDFRQHYMEPALYGWELKPGAPDHLRRVVGKTCAVLRRKDVGLDSVKVRERRVLDLPAALRRDYDKIESEMRLGDWSTKWAVGKWQKLRLLCAGLLDGRSVWTGKADALVELLRGELARDQVVVWSSYNDEVHNTRDALIRASISVLTWTGETDPLDREKVRRVFQEKRVRVLVLQQATVQTGCDLSAADTAIYLSSPPGQMARRQTEDRILRVGKSGALLYVDLVVRDSVDEDVLALLDEKVARSELSLGRALAAKMRERRKSWET